MSLVLRVSGQHGSEERSFDSGSLPVVLGRGQEADWILNDDKLSRKHLRIEMRNSEIWVVDLQSSNGTFDSLDQRVQQKRIADGDELRIGSHFLKFSLSTSKSNRARSPSKGIREKKIESKRNIQRPIQTVAMVLAVGVWTVALYALSSPGQRIVSLTSTGISFMTLTGALLCLAFVARQLKGHWDFMSAFKVQIFWVFVGFTLTTLLRAFEFVHGSEHWGATCLNLARALAHSFFAASFVFAPWKSLSRIRWALAAFLAVLLIGAVFVFDHQKKFRVVRTPELSFLAASHGFMDRKPISSTADLVEELEMSLKQSSK